MRARGAKLGRPLKPYDQLTASGKSARNRRTMEQEIVDNLREDAITHTTLNDLLSDERQYARPKRKKQMRDSWPV